MTVGVDAVELVIGNIFFIIVFIVVFVVVFIVVFVVVFIAVYLVNGESFLNVVFPTVPVVISLNVVNIENALNSVKIKLMMTIVRYS